MAHPLLLQYLKDQHININIVKKQYKEIHNTINSKGYYAVNFQNDSGRYILRNRYFKGSISSNITTHTNINISIKEAYLVFKSFTNYPSYLTLKNQNRPKQDAIILNLGHNLSRAIEFIKSRKQVYTYLNNDDAGHKTTKVMKANCEKKTVSDQ